MLGTYSAIRPYAVFSSFMWIVDSERVDSVGHILLNRSLAHHESIICIYICYILNDKYLHDIQIIDEYGVDSNH